MELFVKNLLTIFAKRLYHRSLYAPKYTSTGFVCSFASFQSKRIDKSLKILSWGCFLGELFWQISQYSQENFFSDSFELSNFDLTKYGFSGGSLVEHLLNALNKKGNAFHVEFLQYMSINPQGAVDMFIFTDEILNWRL